MKKRKRTFSKYNAKKQQWLRNAEKFVLLCVAIFLLFQYVLGVKVIEGASMESSLTDGDIVFFTRLFNPCERGQVVAFDAPNGDHYAKRIVAVAGDIVNLQDGVLYINGKPEAGDYQQYIVGETNPEGTTVTYPFRVAEGNVFILGDNRNDSLDSRSFGQVSTHSVNGTLHVRLGWLYINFM